MDEILDTLGITSSSLRGDGTFWYWLEREFSALLAGVDMKWATDDAWMKKRRGRLSPSLSMTRNRGGRHLNRVGFIRARHAMTEVTPNAMRAAALTQPSLSKSNGMVAGTGTSHAQPERAKCQLPHSTPIMTPAKATLSSKQGQSSAGSGSTLIKAQMTKPKTRGSQYEDEYRSLSNGSPKADSNKASPKPRTLPTMTSQNPCMPQ